MSHCRSKIIFFRTLSWVEHPFWRSCRFSEKDRFHTLIWPQEIKILISGLSLNQFPPWFCFKFCCFSRLFWNYSRIFQKWALKLNSSRPTNVYVGFIWSFKAIFHAKTCSQINFTINIQECKLGSKDQWKLLRWWAVIRWWVLNCKSCFFLG